MAADLRSERQWPPYLSPRGGEGGPGGGIEIEDLHQAMLEQRGPHDGRQGVEVRGERVHRAVVDPAVGQPAVLPQPALRRRCEADVVDLHQRHSPAATEEAGKVIRPSETE